MRIFESSSYSVIDFQQQSLNRWVVNKNKNLQERTVKINPTNALYEELLAFIYSIQNNSLESVTTSDALEALKVACLIQDIIEKK